MRLGELPQGWRWVTSGTVIDVRDGTHDTPKYVAEGIPLVTSKNLVNGIVDFKNVSYISPKDHEQISKRSRVDEGDILLAMIGTIGNPVIVNLDRGFSIKNVALFKLNPKYVDTKFLKYLLDSDVIKQQLDSATRGGTQKFVSLNVLRNLQIPLPPLEQQKRIAAILDKADELRAIRRRAIAKLDELLKSVFLEMFGDPVANPEGWTKGTLGDVIFAAQDGPHVSPTYAENGVPFLSTRHVRPGKIYWEDLKYISQEDALVHWKKCKPEYGDILYTKGGTTGYAKVMDFHKDIAVWVHIALLKTNHSVVNALWLEHMLNSSFCYEQSQRYTHGIANRDLGLKRLIKIELYIPPLKAQEEFVRIAGSVDDEQKKLVRQEQGLNNLFSSLQARAFSGDLTPDALSEVERVETGTVQDALF